VISITGAAEASVECNDVTYPTYCNDFFNEHGYYVIGCNCTVNGTGTYKYATLDSICCQIGSSPIGQIYSFYRLEFRPASTSSGVTFLRLVLGTSVACYDCTESQTGTVPAYVKARILIWGFENEVVDGCTQRKCTPELLGDSTCCGYFDTPIQANVPYGVPDYPQATGTVSCEVSTWLDWSCPWTPFSTGTAIDCSEANCGSFNISELECNLDDIVINIEYITGSDMGAAYSGWADLCP
jgi:hypothetical protein